MQCYTELFPPTGVTHSLSLPFLSAASSNLVVAKTSLIQVFSFNEVNSTTRLVLVAEQYVSGTITAIARIKTITSRSGGEAVLVALKDAKLSLIEWDPERHGISTVSIHFYEGEDLQTNPFAPDLSKCKSILSVDSSSRCAALKFGTRSLAILPFHQAGDDLAMEDYDSEDDKERPQNDTMVRSENSQDVDTPYTSSFVLPLSALDPNLINPIHMAFLYEYRGPTFGILHSQVAPATGLLHERKDVLAYSVFTLDIEQRASTTLLSVSRLPNDLYKVIPLPLPVGGALLVGGNELVHVDQGGKTNSVGVNEFARQNSSFSMADQSDVGMKLEGCTLEQLGTGSGDLLLILNTGEMAILNFNLDGRSVSGLKVRRVASENGGLLLGAGVSSSAQVSQGKMFLGSEETDSVLLSWTNRSALLKRQRSVVGLPPQDAAEIEDEDDMDDYEDDLYSTTAVVAAQAAGTASSNGVNAEYIFSIDDRLVNIGPLGDIAIGRPQIYSKLSDEGSHRQDVTADLEMIAPSGRNNAGGLVIMKREIDPIILSESEAPNMGGIWAFHAKSREELKNRNGSEDASFDRDQYLVTSNYNGSGEGESLAYRITDSGLEELKRTDFESAEGMTIAVGVLANATRVIQVLATEVRSYDSNFGLAQIYPMVDEDTGIEPQIVSTQFCDPYLLIIRDDNSLLLLEVDENGDLDEIAQGDGISSKKWVAGCVYQDSIGRFTGLKGDSQNKDSILLFLINDRQTLQVFMLPDLNSPTYVIENISFLPPLAFPDYAGRRFTTPETIVELVVADLGEVGNASAYLLLRTSNDDLAIYEPFHYAPAESQELRSLKSLRLLKVPSYHQPKTLSEPESDLLRLKAQKKPLVVLPNIAGYSTVFLPGSSPSFILKASTNHPRIVCLRTKLVLSLTGYHADSCDHGFAFIDSEGILRTAQLPADLSVWDSSWISRKVGLGFQVDHVCYHSNTGLYVLGSTEKSAFKLPEDDELHYEWKNEGTAFASLLGSQTLTATCLDISVLPEVEHGSVTVLSPQNWTVIDQIHLDPAERVMCMKSITLEIEDPQEWKEFIAVGTASVRGEDIASKGCVYVFEVIDVVPEPGRPETGRRLKEIAKEELKGSVTAISSIGTEGCLLIAQGQKCMVRGLQSDGSLVPVAFLDMQCYVSVAKELKGTGMCLFGDALKGLWLVGYTEEPYRMMIFGKDNLGLPVIAAEFLPDGKQLYLIMADDECTLHVLQFDPENPKSFSGQRLLHRSSFHTGYFVSSLTVLPRTSSPEETAADTDTSAAQHQVVVTYQTGAVGLLTPLSESSYRRLSALQLQLGNSLDHACGLNPRAYRAAESDGIGGRTVVDGTTLRRWLELGSQRKKDIAGRAGAEVWEIRADLEMVSGAGLGYL